MDPRGPKRVTPKGVSDNEETIQELPTVVQPASFKPSARGAPPLPEMDGEVTRTEILNSRARFMVRDGAMPPVTAEIEPVRVGLSFAENYDVGPILGAGGMGEVRTCRDRRIGREVALKVMRPGKGSNPGVRARFEREARIQGQLEHPAIVPVHDLGVLPDGMTYFTMKRIHGRTLEEIVEGWKRKERAIVDGYPLRKVLAAYSRACLAIAFTHARGVLHRDLKPANVMLGDFGEVYILDWGLAKVVVQQATSEPLDEDALPMHATKQGKVVGTPGYMAPEQVRGEPLDGRADVFGLGAVLFELLALEPLHKRTTHLLADTLRGVDARPSQRAPFQQVPPELDTLCVRACTLDRESRIARADEIAEAIDRYLDGDRDLARRKELAAAAATRARAAAERASQRGATMQMRGEAIREVGAALALDPTNEDAVSTMVRLLVEPPKEAPPEAERALAESRAQKRAISARSGTWAYFASLLVVPFLIWLGVRNWLALGVATGALAATALTAFWVGRSKGFGPGLLLLFLSTFAIGATSLAFGPFIIVPGFAAINAIAFALVVERGAQRTSAVLTLTLAITLPLLAEFVGLLPRSLVMHDGAIEILPRMVGFPPTATLVVLLVSSLVLVAVPAWSVSKLLDESSETERRTFIHLWHLRQFLPETVKPPPESRSRHAT